MGSSRDASGRGLGKLARPPKSLQFKLDSDEAFWWSACDCDLGGLDKDGLAAQAPGSISGRKTNFCTGNGGLKQINLFFELKIFFN